MKAGQNLREKDVKKPEIVTGDEAAEPEAEALECPSCLGPGFKRDCCDSSYCNKCFYRDGCCPGCGAQGAPRGFEYKVADPGQIPQACGWGITHSFLAACLLLCLVALTNEGLRRQTVHGFQCYQWYSSCERSVCVHLNTSDPPQMTDNNDWDAEGCDDRRDQNKMRGVACVTDPEVFRRSNKRLGYDLCWGSQARAEDPSLGGLHGQMKGGNVGSEADSPNGNSGREFEGRGAKFTGGAYVFEDDFDSWEGNFNERDPSTFPQRFYRAALWYNTTNAGSSDKCGSWSGERALRFSGKTERRASTFPMDVRFGGYVNFRLKFAPEGQGATEDCNSAFSGDVDLWYAALDPLLLNPNASKLADQPLSHNWTRWKTFVVTSFPSDGRWTFQSLKLPKEAWSQGTRFMFDQPSFEDKRDHFAVDDVHVWHRFEPKWYQKKWFKRQQTKAQKRAGVAACCLGSIQCSLRLTSKEKEEQCFEVPGFVAGYDSTHEPMNSSSPLFVALAFLLFLSRWLYDGGNLLVAQWAGTEHDVDPAKPPAKCCSSLRSCGSLRTHASAKIYCADGVPPANAAFERRFTVEDDAGWRFRFLFLYTVPLLAACFAAAVSLSHADVFVDVHRKLHFEALTGAAHDATPGTLFTLSVHTYFFLAMAFVLDVAPLWWVAKAYVFCVPGSVPLVDVDARPSRGVFTLEGTNTYEEISLKDFKTHRWVEPEELQRLAGLLIVGCWPYASLTLLLYFCRLPYDAARLFLPIFGALTMCKAYVGGDVLLRACWWFSWLFSTHVDDRHELGMKVRERRNRPMALVGMALAFGLSATLFLLVEIGAVWKSCLFVFLSTGSGCYWGFLCGVGHGLPLEPRLVLTNLKVPGVVLRYEHHSHFGVSGVGPRCCRHAERHTCVDVHSRDRLLYLSVDENQGLYEMLKGIVQGELADF